MSIKRQTILNGRDTHPDTVAQEMIHLFAEPVQRQVLFLNDIRSLSQAVRDRYNKLSLGGGKDVVTLALNDYARTMGYGLQSVSLKVTAANSSKSVLLPNEVADPTIGVLEPELIKNRPLGEYAIVTFPVDPGKQETITRIDGFPPLDGVNKDAIYPPEGYGFPVGDFPRNTITVVGPQLVRTVLAFDSSRHTMPEDAFRHNRKEPPTGVYYCTYETAQ